jgi:hypothetical protein
MANCELCTPQVSDSEWSKPGDRKLRESFTNEWITKADPIFQEDWDTPIQFRDVCSVAEADESMEARFREQAAKWEQETAHLSSPLQRMMHPSYQAILGMGAEHKRDVVRFMLRDLQQNQKDWFLALSFLTQANPINPKDAGKTGKLVSSWLKWGREQGLL